MDNKEIFSRNLRKYMALHDKTRKEVAEALGFSYFTFTDWVKGKKYPRMDKVEKLANYFGILKSDLIEDKPMSEMQKNNDTLTDIIVELRADADFCEIVKNLYALDKDKRAAVGQMLNALLK